MSTSYLLDTSILIQSLKQDATIQRHIARVKTVYISTIALGELYYGAENSNKVLLNLNEVNALANAMTTLPVDSITAAIYGSINYMQRSKGQMLPDNDLWIAATAIRHELTLVARDQHFTWIEGLALEQW